MSDHEYEVGGKVSVTLHDGTKIIDSPITSVGGKSRIILNELVYLVTFDGKMGSAIASVDSYTPPAPTWARPEVRMIARESKPAVKMYRSTLDGAAACPDLWRATSGGFSYTTDELAKYHDWIVYAVAPEVGEE